MILFRLVALFVVTLLLGGCLEENEFKPVDAAMPVETQEQTVTVSLRFHLEELELVDTIDVSEIYLNVGAVFLDPLDGRSETAFRTRQPFALVFDPASGVVALDGPEMAIPRGGRFAVGLLLEPGETVGTGQAKQDGEHLSVGLDGRYRRGSLIVGEPSPLPWRPKSFDRIDLADDWRSFSFRSSDALRVQLAEVTFEDSHNYELKITIHASEWLFENILSITGFSSERVDLHGLLGDMSVSAMQMSQQTSE
jgi:hypothetical protein